MNFQHILIGPGKFGLGCVWIATSGSLEIGDNGGSGTLSDVGGDSCAHECDMVAFRRMEV